MTIKQERQLSMFLAVIKFLDVNIAKVTGLPHFAAYFAHFKMAVLGIQTAAQLQTGYDSKDKTLSKTDMRRFQTMQTLQLLTVLKAYFTFKKITSHQTVMAISATSLRVLADTNFITKCREAYDLAVTVPIADLIPYGITAAWLTEFEIGLDVFGDVIPDPRLMTIDRATATATIAAGFTAAETDLNAMSGLVDILRFSDVPFYNSFANAMKIVNAGYFIGGFYRNGEGVRNCLFSFLRVSDGKVAEYSTNKNGTIQRHYMNDGIYTLTISRTDYESVSGKIVLEPNETYVMEVLMDTFTKYFISARNPKTGEALTIAARMNGGE